MIMTNTCKYFIAAAMCGALVACADDGGGSGSSTAGVSNSQDVGMLSQEQSTSLCEHYAGKFSALEDSSDACCVVEGIVAAASGGGTCADVSAECKANPADYDCEPDTSGDNGCDDPPPTCDGPLTVGQASTCFDDQYTAYKAALDGVTCDTNPDELQGMQDQLDTMPASCDVVESNCADIL